ncbi:hypothetical protein V9T40_005504 [Parthenolecanium corni]|uniref:Uncharacterized protein n=1 Tax=Parthenolecanium corni TaxID=536013 RepID=A0AAN9Y4K8_9HEMI
MDVFLDVDDIADRITFSILNLRYGYATQLRHFQTLQTPNSEGVNSFSQESMLWSYLWRSSTLLRIQAAPLPSE